VTWELEASKFTLRSVSASRMFMSAAVSPIALQLCPRMKGRTSRTCVQWESSGIKEVKNYSMNSLHRKKGLWSQASIATEKDSEGS
jgi:hypothetical protein